MEERKYDIIIYGASGFTGGLVAEYFAGQSGLPAQRWALAGRNLEKLDEVRQRLCRINPDCALVGIIRADSSDPVMLKVMAEQARIVVSTVGPYAHYGEPLVQACVMMGTHYLDITGEPKFVSAMLDKYDALAQKKNVLVVNCCGFDSIPADLGAYFTARQFDDKGPLTIKAFVTSKGQFSGGTWASALNAMAEGLGSKGGAGTDKKPAKGRLDRSIHFDKIMNRWAVPMPVIDPWMVRRSAAVLPDIYGTDFEYGQYLGLKSLPVVAGLLAGVGLIYAGAQFRFLREQMLKFRKPGEGPGPEERSKHFFRLTFIAEGGSRKVKATVSGGDPGYSETSKMLSESALTILNHYNELNIKGGVVTPAGALGSHLLERLQKAGIQFEAEVL